MVMETNDTEKEDEEEEEEEEGEEGEEEESPKSKPSKSSEKKHREPNQEEGSDDEDEDEEPRLKYASLTNNLRPVYRNGDATSAFLVGGDKMVIGTHNGNIHVLSVPSLSSIRVYHAHSASITAVSISPFPPPLAPAKSDISRKNATEGKISPGSKGSPSAKNSQQTPVPLTASNMIYIATSSIDGNVCVASLIDPKDVLLRNFGRPVKAVALSPAYKSDRSYLSGGLAGSLVLTVGGRAGTSTTSTTAGGAVASASGWLSSIGLSANAGRDQVLHSGEGAISTIKWSLSGDYVVWVNEQGIKIMRSNLHLESSESELAWKRISHIDHPNRPGWDEMAGIWKAHVEWIDETGLEADDGWQSSAKGTETSDGPLNGTPASSRSSNRVEKLVVGWSGTIWIINVHREETTPGKEAAGQKIGRAEIVTILRIDCIISGISLYTPTLLLILAYVAPKGETITTQKSIKPGVHRRKNALQPEMRIIHIKTKEEVTVADQLTVSRYETLSANDYHLGVLPAMHILNKSVAQRGTLEVIGGSIEAIGGGLWDATTYPARMFVSGGSIRSGGSPSSSKPASEVNTQTNLKPDLVAEGPHPSTLAHGMKVFIHSPFDCIIATKPTLFDHFTWLDSHSMYEDAWNLLDQHPEAMNEATDTISDSAPSTPSKTQGSLLDFFDDDPAQVKANDNEFSNRVEKEKIRIGEKWVQQLVVASYWSKAGRVCGQVIQTSSSWEHWVWVFARANKFDELTPFIPTTQLRPPLPSMVYELMLGHYISEDTVRFRELLERWPPELFSAQPVIEAISSRLKFIEARENYAEDEETGRDWRLLTEGLAKLYLAISRPRNALGCYIRLQDADAAMNLIAVNHLVDAVADDIPGFILLRVNREAQRNAPMPELAELTLEPIRLLVSEAHHGIVLPETVIEQLETRYGLPNPYLYFYFRALWNGETAPSLDNAKPKRMTSRAQAAEERLLVQEGKSIVSDHGDTAVALFVEYDRDLLMQFLKSSATYNLSKASQICAQRDYIPELVYLLSKEGRTAEALRLIIDSLDDVSQAIAFAKDQNDASLWDDLLDYAMNKPRFIRGLLEEVGTSINPLNLVKRIPTGLEIEGLRDGLARMLKEYEVQESISGGVARVMRGEVNQALQQRSQGTRRGIRFEVEPRSPKSKKKEQHRQQQSSISSASAVPRPGHCAACSHSISSASNQYVNTSYLLAFPCTHVFHVSCLLRWGKSPDYEPPAHFSLFDPPQTIAGVVSSRTDGETTEDDEDGTSKQQWAEEEDVDVTALAEGGSWDRSIGPKVDHAALLRDVIARLGGCPLEVVKDGVG